MQLRTKLSVVAAALIAASSLQAEDYVSVQYLQYDESDNRTSVSAPSIMVNKDFGTDYTLNVSFVADAVSGATPVYHDAASGASASYTDTTVSLVNVPYDEVRLAGGALLTTRFAGRDELSVGLNYSTESDFYSTEASAEYMHWLDSSKNQSIAFGLSYQANEILIKDCTLNSACSPIDADSGASAKMTADVINAQVSFTQNINSESYVKAALFMVNEEGYLSNPYKKVVRATDVVPENRPDTKQAFGTSLKYAYALTNALTAHLAYRYYSDDWGIVSHTADTDLYMELGSNWLFKAGLRYYTQSEADFYNATKDYFTWDHVYASSDERLSAFDALTYKATVDYTINEALKINLGAHFYDQSTGLTATYFITGFTYGF